MLFTQYVELLFGTLRVKTFTLTATVYSLALRQTKMERPGFLYVNLAVKSYGAAELLEEKTQETVEQEK